jgi:hypothetical protein
MKERYYSAMATLPASALKLLTFLAFGTWWRHKIAAFESWGNNCCWAHSYSYAEHLLNGSSDSFSCHAKNTACREKAGARDVSLLDAFCRMANLLRAHDEVSPLPSKDVTDGEPYLLSLATRNDRKTQQITCHVPPQRCSSSFAATLTLLRPNI